MQYHWLKNTGKNNLIIFFTGWSFDYKPFEFLNSDEYDVLMFYDYKDLSLPNIDYDKYNKKILISWSMGVFAAYYLKDKLPDFDKKIAINGTPYPIDDMKGIPHRTFDLTLKYAETGLKGKFYENVFSNDKFLEIYLKNPVQRSVENRIEELVALDKFIKNALITYDDKFYNIAIVGEKDKIIPAKNQLNMWQDLAKVIDCGHFPFYKYSSWDELCK